MGTATCADINARAVYLLQDSGLVTGAQSQAGAQARATPGPLLQPSSQSNMRWTVAEMLLWITDAQRAIVVARPNSYNWVSSTPLVKGVRQKIPADGWLLLTANSNIDATGSIYGRAVTLTTFDQMNRQYPNWRADTPNALAYNYMFDLTDQKAFYVWPPNDGTGFVEVNYSRIPGPKTDLSQTIDVDDIFVPMMVDYVCMRATTKDAEFAPNGNQFGQFFMGLFQMQVGAKDAGEKETNPDAGLPNQPAAR